ncbi:MAG: helix-turn-helix transcriptional regulator [Candidatus Taylorbacteria bacterium]
MANLNKQYLIFLGKKIRSEREKMGVSQEEFGKMAKFHRTYIGMIERGEKNITIFNLKKVAEALKVQVRDLIDF